MGVEMRKTDKYDSMIRAFDCDFDLACQGDNVLSALQKNIENNNENTMANIKLLSELAYLLRTGDAEIRVKTQVLWYICRTDDTGNYMLDTVIGNEVKVVAFRNEIEASIALGKLAENKSEFKGARVKSFEVNEPGKFNNNKSYCIVVYKNGQFHMEQTV